MLASVVSLLVFRLFFRTASRDTEVTWGNFFSGGDSSLVQDQLAKVQKIQASYRAFAAPWFVLRAHDPLNLFGRSIG